MFISSDECMARPHGMCANDQQQSQSITNPPPLTPIQSPLLSYTYIMSYLNSQISTIYIEMEIVVILHLTLTPRDIMDISLPFTSAPVSIMVHILCMLIGPSIFSNFYLESYLIYLCVNLAILQMIKCLRNNIRNRKVYKFRMQSHAQLYNNPLQI